MVADLKEAEGNETVELIEAAGGRAAYTTADLTEEAAVADLVARTVAEFGGLHAAHNNAGITDRSRPAARAPGWRRGTGCCRVNLTSVFLCMKHEIAHMIDNGGGAIVNNLIRCGRECCTRLGALHGSQAGRERHHLVGGRLNTAARGIRVNAVMPGMIDTPMIREWFELSPGMADLVPPMLPGGRMGEPAEIADVAVWLCTDDARYLSGEAIVVDGGGITRA